MSNSVTFTHFSLCYAFLGELCSFSPDSYLSIELIIYIMRQMDIKEHLYPTIFLLQNSNSINFHVLFLKKHHFQVLFIFF